MNNKSNNNNYISKTAEEYKQEWKEHLKKERRECHVINTITIIFSILFIYKLLFWSGEMNLLKMLFIIGIVIYVGFGVCLGYSLLKDEEKKDK